MDFDNEAPELRSAHVIVVGNEKGGAGKSTLSIHLAVALLKAGYKVACIDLDTRQQTLTRFFENRKSWSANAPWPIELPRHCAMARGQSTDVRANEAHEFALFAEAIGAVEHDYEFVVIDIDVFSRVHHDRSQRGAVAHYADLVMEARRKRRLVDNGVIDWVMVRNRMASIASNNARQIAVSIARLAAELRFRVADGLHDRVIFRELFPIGLTALDPIEDASAGGLTTSQTAARREIEGLLAALDLPSHAPGVEHLASRRSWHARVAHYYSQAAAVDPVYG